MLILCLAVVGIDFKNKIEIKSKNLGHVKDLTTISIID